MSSRTKSIWGTSFIFILVLLWQILSMAVNKSYILPSPMQVLNHIWGKRAEIFTVHLPATMKVVGIGLALSIVVGFLLALIMDLDKRIEKAVYPVLTVSQTIPIICISPIFVLWFGYSMTMRVVVVVLINFFAVTVNLFDGFNSAGEGMTELMLTYGANKIQRFVWLRLPAAVPSFFTALKISVPWSMIGAAVAEWLGAPAGIGVYSRRCMAELDAAGLLAPLIVLTALALICNAALGFIEKKIRMRIIKWKE